MRFFSSTVVLALLAWGGEQCNAKTFGFFQGKRSVTFSTINEVTGEQVKDTFEVPHEIVASGIAAIDSAHGLAYFLGYNQTDGKANLVGLDTKSGKAAVDLELPFSEFPGGNYGVGQAIDVDPTTGDIIAIGQTSLANHHYVIRVDFKTKAITTVANISRDVPSKGVMSGLGGGNTLDYTRQVEYVNLQLTGDDGSVYAGTISIDLKTGTSTIAGASAKRSEVLYGLHFDAKSDRIFGFGPPMYPPPSPFTTIEEWQKAEAAKPIHTLAYLNAADGASAPMKVVGGIPGYFLLHGADTMIDPVARKFYTLLQPVQNNPGWVPSTDCAKSPFPCTTGTTCCADPASPTKAGACYKVTNCSTIHDGGGINQSLPFQFVGVDLATAAVTTHPDLCTMFDCPASIGFEA